VLSEDKIEIFIDIPENGIALYRSISIGATHSFIDGHNCERFVN